MLDNIEVAIINQLSDNYSYIIYSTKIKKALIVDPAESKPLIDYLIEKDLSLQGILITHHHSDHTSGIKGLLDFKSVNVYSPSLKISKTSKLIKLKFIISLSLINLVVPRIDKFGEYTSTFLYSNKPLIPDV